MSYSTDGTNGYGLKASSCAPLSASPGPWTIALWFRSASTSQSQKYLLTCRAGAAQWAVIYEYVNDTVEFYSASYTGADPRTNSGLSVTDTNWHHLAYRRAGSGAAAWDKFLDGAKTQISSSVSCTLPDLSGGSTAGLNGLDSGINLGTNCVNGSLAEPAIWTVALTDDEIVSLAKGASPLMVRPPAYYWPLRRELNQPRGGVAFAATSATVSAHPRIMRPETGLLAPYYAAAPPATAIAAIRYHYERLRMSA